MEEHKGIVTFKGQPVTLLGYEVNLGEPAPDFKGVGMDLKAVKGTDFGGQVRILSAVPSLDTSVCAAETRRFDQEAQRIGEGVPVVTISMDLPFAQARWADQARIQHIQFVSDYRDASFGKAYGVLIKELRLLARAVFVVGADDVVHYKEIVKEMAIEPDYDAAMQAASELAPTKQH